MHLSKTQTGCAGQLRGVDGAWALAACQVSWATQGQEADCCEAGVVITGMRVAPCRQVWGVFVASEVQLWRTIRRKWEKQIAVESTCMKTTSLTTGPNTLA